MIDNDYYSEENHGPHEVLELGDLPLIGGGTLPGARLSSARRRGCVSQSWAGCRSWCWSADCWPLVGRGQRGRSWN